MNKNELVSFIAEKSGLTKADSTKALDAFIEGVTHALKSGDDVRLVGFGTFEVVHRPASEGRNPRTGAPLKIKASNQPKFRVGKGLKDAVN